MILYCASGNRSALAAKTLRDDLGYEHVESMTGGYTLWKDRGYDVEVPRQWSPEQRQRYSRHFLLPEIGEEGQQKLLDAKVLLLGAGGLGSPTALYLAAAGVGTLGIVDDDVVDVSNLQRQVIHTTDRVGVSKVDSAEQQIKALNPDVNVVKYETRLDASNIMEIIEGYDVIVDGVDNFPTRYLLNDATVRLQIPVVSAPRSSASTASCRSSRPYDGPVLPLPVPGAAAGRAGAVVRRQRRPRRAARHDGPAAGDRGHQARRRHGRAAHRPAAALRGAQRDVHRAEGPPRPGLPDLLARPRGDLRRGDGRLPGLRGVLRRRRLASFSTLMATIKIPPVLRPSTGGEKEVSADGGDVGTVLNALADQHPSTKTQLFGEGGDLNRYVNVYLNDEDVRVLQGLETPVGESDTLVILPAMAGGAR